MDQPLLPADATLAALHWRYATKKFDPARKLPREEWAKFEQALILAPSSFGLQPYKFVVVTDPAVRAQLRPVAYDQAQVTDCSHLVIFAARTDITDADVDHYLDRIVAIRGVDRAHLDESYGSMMRGSVVHGALHEYVRDWCARQVYIALGQLMTFAAVASVDVCPMEGFSPTHFDEILGLTKQGYRSVVMAAVGHRAADDGAASLPKVRFPAEELLDHR